MKKFAVIIAAVLMVMLVFAGCGNETSSESVIGGADGPTEIVVEENKEAETEETSEAAEENADPYFFVSGDTKIYIMSDADPILSALGEPISTFEADSCAFQGKDLFYYYDGFELTVNDVDGTNKITAIKVVDDTVATPQGLKIGSAEEDITAKFGEAASVDAGLYAYKYDTTNVQIKADGGKVASIVYVYSDVL